MKEKEKNHRRRIRGLIVLLVFTAIILAISTYAWFIGMRTVNVSSFDVEIASTEDLLLSLNGIDWMTTVYINSTNFDDDTSNTDYGNVYQGNTNWWAGFMNVGSSLDNPGLIPMSSVGNIDDTVSRLILFEKASMTPTKGGYRLLASRVPNDGATEVKGYVAFDLFIRNFSGTQYNMALNMEDEEAIYLATDSEVTVASSGVANTGIENSVRVGFAQIGRVIGTNANTPVTPLGTEHLNMVEITCADTADVTGICEAADVNGASRTAHIWEPNDIDHVSGAINWYDTSCKPRTTGPSVADASYNTAGTCGSVLDGVAYPTYAVRTKIDAIDGIDVYDGLEYNTFTDNSFDPAATYTPGDEPKLYAFPYFTDTMKMVTGVDREPIFTLAPNSVTKIRVYIWIEGQDIDNYDYAAIGKMISVNFGFTKQRFEELDVNYTGPDLRPVWTIGSGEYRNGEVATADPLTLTAGASLTTVVSDFLTGVSIFDNVDGVIATSSPNVIVTHNIVPDAGGNIVAGTYEVKYRATNSNGLSSIVTRPVTVS